MKSHPNSYVPVYRKCILLILLICTSGSKVSAVFTRRTAYTAWIIGSDPFSVYYLKHRQQQQSPWWWKLFKCEPKFVWHNIYQLMTSINGEMPTLAILVIVYRVRLTGQGLLLGFTLWFCVFSSLWLYWRLCDYVGFHWDSFIL